MNIEYLQREELKIEMHSLVQALNILLFLI